MLVVADSSALVALSACNGLPLVERLYEELRVPPAVFDECTVPGKPQAEQLEAYLRARVVDVDLRQFVIAVAGLGQGELEAMVLYKKLSARLLLVDDHRARKVALLNGIAIVGSVGILVRAKESGLIQQIRPLLSAIQASGVHYSEQLLAEALLQAGEQ